jgi:hypothetical protein
LHEALSAFRVREERFNFGSKRFVFAAGGLDERQPLVRLTRQRVVIQTLYRYPAFG